MRRILAFLVCLTTTLEAATTLVSGTYMRGSNITEPRPQKSKYLETIQAGVVVMEDKAGFYLMVKPRKQIKRPVYATIEYENPLDGAKPFINDMELLPDGGEFDFSSPDFIKGLRNYQDYKITVRIYEARGDKNPMDVLVQKLRCYVDTTGPQLKVFKGLKAAVQTMDVAEPWVFGFDGRNWRVGNQAANKQQTLHEYILEGEVIVSWTELVTSYFSAKPVKPKDLYEYYRKDLSKNCSTLQISIIEEDANTLIFAWRHCGCNGYPAQHELRRITRTKSGTLMLSYVKKTQKLADEELNKWLSILKSATLATKD